MKKALMMLCLLFCCTCAFAEEQYVVTIKNLSESEALDLSNGSLRLNGRPVDANMKKQNVFNEISQKSKSLAWPIAGGVFLIVLLVLTFSSFKIVRPSERGLIERLGKYHRFANPGFHFVVPFVEQIIMADITENMVESGKREMITNDNLNATIDALIFYKVKPDEENIKASEYNVNAYEDQIIALTKTALRNIIGTMTLKDANSERNKINIDLLALLAKETANWGIEVVRAELKEIDPPKDVQEAMNQVVKASNAKLAAVDFATAAETQADGAKRAAIKNAEGIKQAAILEAEGKSKALELVNKTASETMTGGALDLRKIEAIEKAFGSATKILVPTTGNLMNLVGEITK